LEKQRSQYKAAVDALADPQRTRLILVARAQASTLLDATGAYHREIARQMGNKGLHFTTPMMQLQDPRQTKVLLVTLAEATPVLEAASLQADLRRAVIDPWAWIVNNRVAVARPVSALLRRRARNELAQIDAVATQHARRHAVVALQRDEPVGIARLLALAG
jgi:arsenite-transporting ATPase